MKNLLTVLLFFLLTGVVYPAPPDPSESDEEIVIDIEDIEFPEAPEIPESLIETLDDIEDLKAIDPYALKDLEKRLIKLRKKYEGIGRVLEEIDKGHKIEELILGGDSIFILLDNDSSFTLRYSEGFDRVGTSHNDIIRIGSTITIEEDEVIEGDVVSAFGDVIVHGTVEGGVIAFSGDIYISSTGNVENGVLAFSGKVKQEPGSRVGAVTWGSHYVRTDLADYNRSVFRTMARVFIIIYIIWIILAATCASLLKSNVRTVGRYIKEDGVFKSFFMGYLAYFLALIIFIGLSITILGLPLALLGVPLALLAATILSSTAISNLIGVKILNREKYSFRTFFYGSLFLGLIPGLLFLVQLITGNLAIMVFSWIVIGLFIFIILPVGLGAVISTRFGTRLGKSPQPQAETESS